MLEALVFDVDGTIAETEGYHRRAFNRAFFLHGIPLLWGEEEYRRLLRVPGGWERIGYSARLRGIAMPREVIGRIHQTKTELYIDLLEKEGIAWRSGVRRLMQDAAQARIKVGIASVTATAAVNPLLAKGLGPDWRSVVQAVVTGEDVARKKPAPDAYLEAIRRLGVRADNAVAFEDSRAGVLSARAAGLYVIGTPSRWLVGDDLSEADLVLDQLGDAKNPWASGSPFLGRRWLELDCLMLWHRTRTAAKEVWQVDACEAERSHGRD